MSQTDNITYLSADDLLGKTDRTKLITVEIPELAGDDGKPGYVLLTPPPAIVQERFLASAKNREMASKVKAANSDADYEDLATDDNFRVLVEMVRDVAVTPDRERLFPRDLTATEILECMQVRVLARMVAALTEAMSDQAEEGKELGKKSKKARRSGGRTKPRSAAASKSGS